MVILKKIGWKTRRWNLTVHLLDIFIHDGDDCWGFTLFEVVKDYNSYALLAFEFRLPNGAEKTKVQITHFDFLFLVKPCYNWFYDLQENVMWGYKPNWFEKLCLKIFDK